MQGHRVFAARCDQNWRARLGWGVVEMNKATSFLTCLAHERGGCICKAEVLFLLACQEDACFGDCAEHRGKEYVEPTNDTRKQPKPIPDNIQDALKFIRHYQTPCYGVCRKVAREYTVPDVNTSEAPFLKYRSIGGVKCPVIGDFGDALEYQRPCTCGSNMGRADR